MTAGEGVKKGAAGTKHVTDKVVDSVEKTINDVTDSVDKALNAAAASVHHAASQPKTSKK